MWIINSFMYIVHNRYVSKQKYIFYNDCRFMCSENTSSSLYILLLREKLVFKHVSFELCIAFKKECHA